jgi:hypothetical protein
VQSRGVSWWSEDHTIQLKPHGQLAGLAARNLERKAACLHAPAFASPPASLLAFMSVHSLTRADCVEAIQRLAQTKDNTLDLAMPVERVGI